MRGKLVPALFLLLLIPISFNFFSANFIDARLLLGTNLFFCGAAILLSLPFAFKSNQVFELPVQLICLSVLFSIAMAHIVWQQDIVLTLKVTVPLLLWIVFFGLLRFQIPTRFVEAIVVLYAVVYIVLYFFQFLNPDILFFGAKQRYNEWYYDRGIFRVLFPGAGIFFLGIFIALNKLTTQAKGRFFWLLLCAAGLVIPVMQATRTYIAGVVLLYLFHFLKNLSPVKKLVVVGVAVVACIAVTRIDLPVFRGLAKAQQETRNEGLQNQRIITADYFLTQFSPNLPSKVFGNGVPAGADQSAYGKFIDDLGAQDINLFDVGIIGMYAMFGILAVIGYIMIWTKSFMLRLPPQYSYAKYYLWFLIVTSLTYDAVYSANFLIATVLALYIFQTSWLQEQKKNRAAEPALNREASTVDR